MTHVVPLNPLPHPRATPYHELSQRPALYLKPILAVGKNAAYYRLSQRRWDFNPGEFDDLFRPENAEWGKDEIKSKIRDAILKFGR